MNSVVLFLYILLVIVPCAVLGEDGAEYIPEQGQFTIMV
jgi:hypothetical protein